MALPADGHPAESLVAAAAVGMAAPPGGADHLAQQHVDDVIVTVAASDRAAVVEMTQRAASPTSGRAEDGTFPETPASCQGVAAEITLAVDPLEDLIQKERQRVKKIREARKKEEQPCIYRVHPTIRQQDSEAYEPKLVSIGPLHRSDKSLLPMEELKFSYLDDLLSRSAENKLSNYIRVIRECEPRARNQYAEKIELDAEEFVKMLVVDGCFIIEYFLKRVFMETQETAQLAGVRWGFAYLRRDLMLLENQIPFFVLVKLFGQSTIPFTGERKDPLTLMEITLGFLGASQLPTGRQPTVDNVLHLLHLYQICLKPSGQEEPRSCWQLVLDPFKMATSLIRVTFFGLLYLVLFRKLPCSCTPTEKSAGPRMIPCATELGQAGVKFRKKSGVDSFLNVSFTEGTLKIPFLPVQETTSSTLRNFIALEQCCPSVGNHFTSYAVFLDNIINTESDVAVLRNCGIIESKLGSDKEVVKVFNALCKGTHLKYEQHYNAPLFKEVKEYCEVPHHRWRASLKSTYFGSPWTAISLLAGILIFTIAVTQGYNNIFRRRK